MGIRKMQNVNTAVLGKLGWKVLSDPDYIWVKVVSAKYLDKEKFLKVKKTANCTIMWKFILDHMYLNKKGIC